ncbi:MAG: urea carboxylase-associated family protein [Pseudomonadota bacterium]
MQVIPARRGRAVRVNQGQSIRVINTHGHQVVDFWAFSAEDLSEFLSMEHLRATLTSIFPKIGDDLVSNRRRPILHFTEDTSPGIHDTLMAACDDYRYGLLGCTEYHDNCTDNLHAALRRLGEHSAETPSPFNLWMNIPVAPDGSTGWGEPVSKPGDHVEFRAAMDCIAVMSCCPQDILPINKGSPVEAHYEVLS